jgi:putative intracellular protease/amidase
MPSILIVLTSHDRLGDTGEKTGFWLEEFAAPYYVFRDAGLDITLASPAGGQPPLDPKSSDPDAQTAATRRFEGDLQAQAALASTRPLASVDSADFDAVFYPGGHGPLWDLHGLADSIRLIEAFWASGKVVAAVCHAPAVLLQARDASGNALIAGRQVTGFTNDEEAAVNLTDVVPFLLEDELKSRGGVFSRAEPFAAWIRRDGLLITGQNPASSEPVAFEVLDALGIDTRKTAHG